MTDDRPLDVVTFGRGLEHMAEVGADLRGQIGAMAAMTAAAGASSPQDVHNVATEHHAELRSADLLPDDDFSDADGYTESTADDLRDRAQSAADAYALEVDIARWTGRASDGLDDLARARFLLSFGGPNVWLDVSYHGESPDRVTLERFWGGDRDRAETEDPRALRIADDFVRAFFVID